MLTINPGSCTPGEVKSVRARLRSRPAKPDKEPRRRRAPEEARKELLDAADRVFAEHQPDAVGLKDIAREAGVSHALVTHYFGTYAGLVEATLERRIRALRVSVLERMREGGALDRPVELLGMLFRALEDPVHVRLTRWMMASERPSSIHALGLHDQGLREVARQVIVQHTWTGEPPQALRDEVELALVVAVSSAYGYAMMKGALAGALGRAPSVALDEAVQATLGAMLEAHLRGKLDEADPVN